LLISFLKKFNLFKKSVNVTISTPTVATGELNVALGQFSNIQNVTRQLVIVGYRGHHRSTTNVVVGEKNNQKWHTTDTVAMMGDFVNRKIHCGTSLD
jgi:hypothetical protein